MTRRHLRRRTIGDLCLLALILSAFLSITKHARVVRAASAPGPPSCARRRGGGAAGAGASSRSGERPSRRRRRRGLERAADLSGARRRRNFDGARGEGASPLRGGALQRRGRREDDGSVRPSARESRRPGTRPVGSSAPRSFAARAASDRALSSASGTRTAAAAAAAVASLGPVGAAVAAASPLLLLRRRGRSSSAGDPPPSSPCSERMPPGESLRRALVFWRAVGPIVVHYKLTALWMTVRGTSPERRTEVWEGLHERHAPESLEVILKLRGLYVKVGQVLSSRPDFVPRQYVDRFSSLQDIVPPYDAERMKSIARDSLLSEHGLSFDDVFETFEEDVLGSASIGQVHRAVLRPEYADAGGYEGGAAVAVKVMHPDAQDRFAADLKVFRWLCRIALPGWGTILMELQRQFMTEFDYTNEADSLSAVRNNMARSPYARRVKVPEPVRELCTRNVLVMEMLEGRKLAESVEERLADALGGNVELAREVMRTKQRNLFLGTAGASSDEVQGDNGRNKSFFYEIKDILEADECFGQRNVIRRAIMPLKLMSLVRKARSMLDLLVDVHGHQIFLDGAFNGDPHPGNILEMPDGRLGLIDYGQFKLLSEEERVAVSRVVAALGKESISDGEVAEAMRHLGFRTRKNRDDILAQTASLYFDSDSAGKEKGYATPQLYFQYLISCDPILKVPDAAVFVARTSFLFRGMGSLLQQQLHTARRWSHHAQLALNK